MIVISFTDSPLVVSFYLQILPASIFSLRISPYGPSNFNPSLNNAECVVDDDSKHRFESVEKIFPQMCWIFLLFSLTGGHLISMICIQLFNDYKDKTVITAILFSCSLSFVWV